MGDVINFGYWVCRYCKTPNAFWRTMCKHCRHDKDYSELNEDPDTYDPKRLSFFNGLSTIEDKDTNKQLSFFDYIFNKLKTKD